jgi:biopolymer transport protein ExbD
MKASRWLLAAGALCHDGCSAHSEGGDQVSFSKPRQIVVTVTQSNEIFVNNSPTTIADLEAVLREMVAPDPEIPVILEGDRDVILGRAVRILSAAQRAGAMQIAIAPELLI